MNTPEIILIIVSFALFALLSASASLAAYLLGVTRTQGKFIVQSARREKRLNQSLVSWQDKVLIRAGAGSLRPAETKPKPDDEKRTPVKFVSPSEAIERQKAESATKVKASIVPPAVKTNFLAEVSKVNLPK